MSAHPDYVQVGSSAVVRFEDGTVETYTVVPAAEANPRAGLVSAESPIGRALLGCRLGEAVVIPVPGRSFTVTIESVVRSS